MKILSYPFCLLFFPWLPTGTLLIHLVCFCQSDLQAPLFQIISLIKNLQELPESPLNTMINNLSAPWATPGGQLPHSSPVMLSPYYASYLSVYTGLFPQPLLTAPWLISCPSNQSRPHLLLRPKITMMTTPICLLPVTPILVMCWRALSQSSHESPLRKVPFISPIFTFDKTEASRGQAAQANTVTIWTQFYLTTCPASTTFLFFPSTVTTCITQLSTALQDSMQTQTTSCWKW